MTNPNIYAQPQYPQQPVYKDAQLSFQEAPPSYDAVTAAANSTQQIPPVICTCIVVAYSGESVHIVFMRKCKKHFIKILKDVGMVVPKIKETRL